VIEKRACPIIKYKHIYNLPKIKKRKEGFYEKFTNEAKNGNNFAVVLYAPELMYSRLSDNGGRQPGGRTDLNHRVSFGPAQSDVPH
jgi:hypothetical protein